MAEKQRFTVKHQNGQIRCAWCWEITEPSDSHTFIESRQSPYLALRFHHSCWGTYLSLSGVELGNIGASTEWPAQKIELLRLHVGLPVAEFAKLIQTTAANLTNYMNGDQLALTANVFNSVRTLANQSSFGIKRTVDWSDPAAIFSLRMSNNWTKSQLAGALGVPFNGVALLRYHPRPIQE